MPRPVKRARSKQRPVDDEVIRAELVSLAEAGPVDWNKIPVGRMTEQASWLVADGQMQIVVINKRVHVALISFKMQSKMEVGS